MGLLTTFSKAKPLISATKATGLDAAQVMTASGVTPDNPGSWEHLSVPLPTKARQFTAAESITLVQRAAQVKAQVASTANGYKAIRDMGRAFAQANVNHESTRTTLAQGATVSAVAKAASASQLHAMRPAYAQAQRKLEVQAAIADGAIAGMG